MTKETILKAINALKADKYVWVAGSAAICPALAEDIDIWVFPKSSVKYEQFDQNIWTPPSAEQAANYPPSLAVHKLEVAVPSSDFWEGHKIQVMFVQPHIKNIKLLLDQFDCSCHRYARDKDGYLMAHPLATLPGAQITLFSQAEYSIKRKEDFTLRYANNPILWL
jgi:hypothetical protein